jgi:hypothetical protein
MLMVFLFLFCVLVYFVVNAILAVALNYWIHIAALPIGEEPSKEVRLNGVRLTFYFGILVVTIFAVSFLVAKFDGTLDDMCAEHRIEGRGFRVY